MNLRLELYTPEELAKIVTRSATILGMPIEEAGAMEIASRSRGTPRIANRFLRRVRDFAEVMGDGTIIVARDIAHAKLKARLDKGEELPDYFKNHPVLYAGPAKTPEGYPCGSMGPTTSNRMDPYVDEFQAHGGSLIMIGKGNRTQVVTDACQKHGGFYLGTIGGVAAVLSQDCIKSIECVEYPELGTGGHHQPEPTAEPHALP